MEHVSLLNFLYENILSMIKFINSLPVKIIRLCQFSVALMIFFYAALMPLSPDDVQKIPTTFLHILGNILLMGSAWVALYQRLSLPKICLCVCAVSMTCEFTQSLTQTRVTDPWDFGCNLFGIGLGYIACWTAQRLLNRYALNANA